MLWQWADLCSGPCSPVDPGCWRLSRRACRPRMPASTPPVPHSSSSLGSPGAHAGRSPVPHGRAPGKAAPDKTPVALLALESSAMHWGFSLWGRRHQMGAAAGDGEALRPPHSRCLTQAWPRECRNKGRLYGTEGLSPSPGPPGVGAASHSALPFQPRGIWLWLAGWVGNCDRSPPPLLLFEV